jgi:ketosteroid isomerase-like protein
MERSSETAIRLVTEFNEALNAHDLEAMMSRLAPDCVFENTSPAPDGRRYVGQAAVRSFWEEFFGSGREKRIEIEEIFAAGGRCVMRWVYRWSRADGSQGHVRGVDLYTIRNGLIAEKLSYVKG